MWHEGGTLSQIAGTGSMRNGNADPAQQLTYNQKLISEYKKKLKPLIKIHPVIYASIADKNISDAASEMFVNVGFTCHTPTKNEQAELAKTIGTWLKKGHMALLQYRPKEAGTNLISLLRAIQGYTTNSTFSGLIPVFIGTVNTDKQIEIFRQLGNFGIRYACFISPNTLPEKNAEELLDHLAKYTELLNNGFKEAESGRDSHAKTNVQKPMDYKKFLHEGEKLLENGEYEKAIKILTKAIDIGPNAKTLVKRGDAYYRIEQITQALNDYREANRLEQSLPEPYAMISTCCFAILKKETIVNKPEEVNKYFKMGMKYLHEAVKLAEAMEFRHKDAPEMDIKTPYSKILTAIVEADFRNIGFFDFDAQIADLSTRILNKVDGLDFYDSVSDKHICLDRAMLFARNKKFEKAEEMISLIISENPNMAPAVLNKYSTELRNNGVPQRAFNKYLEMLSHDIPDKKTIIELMKISGLRYADSLRETGKTEEAISAYKKILAHRPRQMEYVLCDMAMAYLEMQDQAGASRTLMEAVYINPALTKNEEFARFKDLKNISSEMIKKINTAFSD